MSNIDYETEAGIISSSRFIGLPFDQKEVPYLPIKEDITYTITQNIPRRFFCLGRTFLFNSQI